MRCALAGWLGFPLITGQEDGLIYEAPPCANAWQIFYMRSLAEVSDFGLTQYRNSLVWGLASDLGL